MQAWGEQPQCAAVQAPSQRTTPTKDKESAQRLSSMVAWVRQLAYLTHCLPTESKLLVVMEQFRRRYPTNCSEAFRACKMLAGMFFSKDPEIQTELLDMFFD
eukprot:Hpha_TRINITY_DN15200_c0_g1::TRINITY_DN15200_c0_g1_i2::g.65755::m.65755